MSLINQVLNELEKRGANIPMAEPTLRAIPSRRPSRLARYGLFALVLLAILLLVAKWYAGREEMVAVGNLANGAENSMSPALSEDAAQTVSTPQTGGELVAMSDYAMPAAKLSFELSSIPLPDSRRDRGQSEELEVPEPVVVPVREAPPQREQAPSKPKVVARPEVLPQASATPMPLKQISPQQQAENDLRKANLAAQQGRVEEAVAGYEAVLRLNPSHREARRALVGVLLNARRNADAERLLQEGLQHDAQEASFAMLLARLQVERNAVPLALETLQKTLPHADSLPDYHAFVAALLQRQGRHKEAITHFQIALQMAPNSGVWLMGLGISLQAVQRNEDAHDVFQRALATRSLSPELTAFVQQKINGF